MAEVLYILNESNGPEGERWPRGAPVVVAPDGHAWGTKEGPPRFFVMHVDDEDIDSLGAPVFNQPTGKTPELILRSTVLMDIDSLNPVDKAAANAGALNAKGGNRGRVLAALRTQNVPARASVLAHVKTGRVNRIERR